MPWLHDIDGSVLDHPAKRAQAELLLAPRNRQVERVGNCLGFPQMVERDRLLEEGVPVSLHQAAQPDRVRDIVRTVRIGVQRHLRPECLAHQRDQALASARKGIGVAAHATADPEFERRDAFDSVLGSRPDKKGAVAAQKFERLHPNGRLQELWIQHRRVSDRPKRL